MRQANTLFHGSTNMQAHALFNANAIGFYAQTQLSRRGGDGEVELHVLGCWSTYKGQTVTNA